MLNPYFTEMNTRLKQEEIAHALSEKRLRDAIAYRPSPLRQSVASAIIRFGMLLDSRAYHCPDAATQR